jgi:hypothetical protein
MVAYSLWESLFFQDYVTIELELNDVVILHLTYLGLM